VTWTAANLAGLAGRWFRRLRRTDELSRIVQAAAGSDVGLSGEEFSAVRRLLELEDTWVLVGRGPVEDLAVRIGQCLVGREAGDALVAGRAIARGLLEFAVRDLKPEWFGRVLFARLDRLQADQASSLDIAMVAAHADLAALVGQHESADAERFERLVYQLARVLDRLPDAPAGRGELAVYLAVLSTWLNSDPWLQRASRGGSVVAPAELERKLRINAAGPDADADELARRCSRLIVLGRPGSGKTWLARRTARLCADAALQALAAGAEPDEIEMPLYTTCSRLAASLPGDGIRRAVVASALGHLPDLGGARVLEAVQAFFEERNAPTLLVADSLDEALGVDDRIRQADTLPPAWRIVLTSRPGSWDRQLNISENDPSRRVGVLRPLRYPDDVEPFITAWFNEQPAKAARLVAQIRSRPGLQQAATMPLIMAFYCIVGSDKSLPTLLGDLHSMVIRRMLTGRWRRSGDRDVDPDACLETLRIWAMTAAEEDPLSGIGTWPDEFVTPRARQHSRDDREAMDHIAVPLGPADHDGMTARRFVHRSIREYLTAEHIALTMPVREAAAELAKHVWYDPDWEFAAPAALARHPQRDLVLADLIGHVTGGSQQYADLAAADGCHEFRLFLARVAQQSTEDAWSQWSARLIGEARRDILISGPKGVQIAANPDWPTTNQEILKSALGLLKTQANHRSAQDLADAMVGFAITDSDRAQALSGLLHLLATQIDPWLTAATTRAIEKLATTDTERASTRLTMLRLLAAEEDAEQAIALAETIAILDPTEDEQVQVQHVLSGLLAGETDAGLARALVDEIGVLGTAEEERARIRQALLRILVAQTSPRLARALAEEIALLQPADDERAQVRQALLRLLTHQTDPQQARTVASATVRFTVTDTERAQVRQALRRILTRQIAPRQARAVAAAASSLAITRTEQEQAVQTLLQVLATQTDPQVALGLTEEIARLNPTAGEQAQVRQDLIRVLTNHSDPRQATAMTATIARLDPADDERARIRQALLHALSAQEDAHLALELTQEITGLDPGDHERARIRQALLHVLSTQPDATDASHLTGSILNLAPTEDERAQILQALVHLVTVQAASWQVRTIATAITWLSPAEGQIALVRQGLLRLLTCQARPERAWALAQTIVILAPPEDERAQARQALLGLLAVQADARPAHALAAAIVILAPPEDEQAQARQALLGLLAVQTDAVPIRNLTEVISSLARAEGERAQVRQALLGLLAVQADAQPAHALAAAIAKLAPPEDERTQAWQLLRHIIANQPDHRFAVYLAEHARTETERTQIRPTLLRLLPAQTNSEAALELTAEVIRLKLADNEQVQVRQALLRLLAAQADPRIADRLTAEISRLKATVADFHGLDNWQLAPSATLLAAVRQNSENTKWLAALPQLPRTQPALR
jgi:hypothetical protein